MPKICVNYIKIYSCFRLTNESTLERWIFNPVNAIIAIVSFTVTEIQYLTLSKKMYCVSKLSWQALLV
jgi:hypothetical protein